MNYYNIVSLIKSASVTYFVDDLSSKNLSHVLSFWYRPCVKSADIVA